MSVGTEVAELVDQHQKVAVREVGEDVGETRPGGDDHDQVFCSHVFLASRSANRSES
jgi:hypothetical protein